MAHLAKMRSTLKMTLKVLFLIIGIVNLDLCGVRGDNLTMPTKTTLSVTTIVAKATPLQTTTTTRTKITNKEAKAGRGIGTSSTTTATARTTTTTATPPTQSVASTQTYLPPAKLDGNPTRLRIQQCREGCYKMFLSNGVPCQQSRECLACWSECMKPPPLSSPYDRKLKWYGATWSLTTVSMVQQDSLVLVEVAWQRLRWPNQCLVTWEVSGGGLMGNLLTESCNVQLSLWPDTKYRVQVTCKNKFTGDMSRSQPLMVDTAKAAKSPKNNNNHLLRRQHSAAIAADDEATAIAIQQEEEEKAKEAASVDPFPAENIVPILPYDENDDIDNDGNNIDVAVQSAAEQQMNKHTNFIFNWHTHSNGNMAAAAAASATATAATVDIVKKKNENGDNDNDATAANNDNDDDDSASDDDNDADDNNNKNIEDISDIDDNASKVDEKYNSLRHKQHAFNMLSLATSIDMQKPLLFCLIAGSLLLLALVLLMCLLCRVRRTPDDKAALLRDETEVSSLDEDDEDCSSAIGVSLPPILAIIAADGCKTNRLSDLRYSSTALKV